ncbi:MAG: hypothetical protein B6I24_09405 [Bacteroidetes bacterium 4572_128]|nr:MAG: hypothetical protein B6I24_09405 [Bacteroidetes bacterium 4572_128]
MQGTEEFFELPLESLIIKLQNANFYIDINTRLRIYEIIKIIGNEYLNNLENLKFILSPIFVKNEKEQKKFSLIFDEYLKEKEVFNSQENDDFDENEEQNDEENTPTNTEENFSLSSENKGTYEIDKKKSQTSIVVSDKPPYTIIFPKQEKHIETEKRFFDLANNLRKKTEVLQNLFIKISSNNLNI